MGSAPGHRACPACPSNPLCPWRDFPSCRKPRLGRGMLTHLLLLKRLVTKESSIKTSSFFLCWDILLSASEWHQGHFPWFPWCQSWSSPWQWLLNWAYPLSQLNVGRVAGGVFVMGQRKTFKGARDGSRRDATAKHVFYCLHLWWQGEKNERSSKRCTEHTQWYAILFVDAGKCSQCIMNVRRGNKIMCSFDTNFCLKTCTHVLKEVWRYIHRWWFILSSGNTGPISFPSILKSVYSNVSVINRY